MCPAIVTEGDFCGTVVWREDTDSPSSLCVLCSRLPSNFSTWDHDGSSVATNGQVSSSDVAFPVPDWVMCT